jgi:hypothetical protein
MDYLLSRLYNADFLVMAKAIQQRFPGEMEVILFYGIDVVKKRGRY